MEAPRWLDPLQARAWRGWVMMNELVRGRVARDLQVDCGLSDSDYAVLVNVSESPDHRIRMTDLATGLHWSKSRLSHQVGRMEARGLLCREECPSDARGAFAVLTDSGLARMEQAAPLHVASVRRHLIDLLDREQLRQLTAISDVVLADALVSEPEDDGSACSSLEADGCTS